MQHAVFREWRHVELLALVGGEELNASIVGPLNDPGQVILHRVSGIWRRDNRSQADQKDQQQNAEDSRALRPGERSGDLRISSRFDCGRRSRTHPVRAGGGEENPTHGDPCPGELMHLAQDFGVEDEKERPRNRSEEKGIAPCRLASAEGSGQKKKSQEWKDREQGRTPVMDDIDLLIRISE